MGYTSYIGRVGALAVALGIGFAIANGSGVACAETGSEANDTPSADAGQTSKDDAKDAVQTGPAENDRQTERRNKHFQPDWECPRRYTVAWEHRRGRSRSGRV